MQIIQISSVFDRWITRAFGRCNADDRRQSTRLPFHHKPYAEKTAATFVLASTLGVRTQGVMLTRRRPVGHKICEAYRFSFN